MVLCYSIAEIYDLTLLPMIIMNHLSTETHYIWKIDSQWGIFCDSNINQVEEQPEGEGGEGGRREVPWERIWVSSMTDS